mgnify:CR=1 FL=1
MGSEARCYNQEKRGTPPRPRGGKERGGEIIVNPAAGMISAGIGIGRITKLYNDRPAWLDNAYWALDEAVAAAYGWEDWPLDEETILARLLKLNLLRDKVRHPP